jgi:MazG family protein
MSPSPHKILDRSRPAFDRLVELLAVLRSPEGCAWDRQQTHSSLVPYLIEEAYEAIAAIEKGDSKALKEELGDLLCQIVFHAQLASESGKFSINDSIESIITKLVERHPHVFGDQKSLAPKEVRDQWERIKVKSGERESVLGGIPRSMPALTMAYRIGEKSGGIGFDWKNAQDILDKLREEIEEISDAIEKSDSTAAVDEIGDLLFATASLARKLGSDPEMALRRSLEKFKTRFGDMERQALLQGINLHDLVLEEMEARWQEIKKREQG